MRRHLGRAIGPALFVIGTVLVALLPRFMGEFRLLQFTLVAVYVIALLGLNILTGYAGQLSLGTAAFMAVGAFMAFNFELRAPWMPTLVSFALAGLCAAGVGVMNIDNGFGAGCLAHRINVLGERAALRSRK